MSSEETHRLDAGTIAALYVEFSDELRAFLLGVLRDSDRAAEALQATFVKVAEAGHTARKDSFKGWLFKVALNEALGIKRRLQRDARLVARPVWQRTDVHERPDETAVRRESIEQVRLRLNELPEELRQIVELRIFSDLTFARIADELKLPLGTVLTRMRTALKRLAARFPDES